MIRVYSDRSTCVTQQACPRRRFYEHEFPTGGEVPGVVADKLNIDTTLGSAFHAGVYWLLNGNSLEEAVGKTLQGDGKSWKGYWPSVKTQDLALNPMEDANYVYFEQASLAEALVRAYYYYALPRLLEDYTILETEYDEQAIFSDPTRPGFEVLWGIRTDGLLQNKVSGDLSVLSLKTKKEWKDSRDEKKARRDMQGLTEMASVEQRLKRWHKEIYESQLERPGSKNPGNLVYPIVENTKIEFNNNGQMEKIPKWAVGRFLKGDDPSVFSVKMEFALKGYRSEYPKGSGQWKYSNPLIRPYRRAEDLGSFKPRKGATNSVAGDYALYWNFEDEAGGNHTLGKGWRVVNIWEDMGVKNWIEYCLENEIQGFRPCHALEKQFILPMEFMRNPGEMKSKIRQIVNQEWRVEEGRAAVAEVIRTNPAGLREVLDVHFPQQADFPHECSYCPCEEICYGPEGYMYNPLGNPKFTTRTPNHRAEGLVQIE